MLDGAIKTIMVDDSKTVGELLVTICSRIGVCYSSLLLYLSLFSMFFAVNGFCLKSSEGSFPVVVHSRDFCIVAGVL